MAIDARKDATAGHIYGGSGQKVHCTAAIYKAKIVLEIIKTLFSLKRYFLKTFWFDFHKIVWGDVTILSHKVLKASCRCSRFGPMANIPEGR